MKRFLSYFMFSCLLPMPALAQKRVGMTDLDRFDYSRIDEVDDRATGLTWTRCIYGQNFVKRKGCVGNASLNTWGSFKSLNISSWRIPTRGELVTIIDKYSNEAHSSPRIDIVVFSYEDRSILNFWTSTEASPNTAWAINFGTGPIAIKADKSSEFAVRLVKGTFVPPLPEVKPPKDIGNYISRRDDCEHFAGEDAYDKERAQYLDQMFAELQCNTLGADEKKLRKKYQGKPAMLKWLDEKPHL